MPRRFSMAALVVGSLTLLTPPALALDILLTNDDGFDAPGITALRAALERGGHDVTVVAPSSNRSGSSASLTLGAPIEVERIERDLFSVDASPASSVILGVSTLLRNEPDLVVSGINTGSNIGPSTPISGTVGAAIAAIAELNRPIPAIAVSTDLVSDGEPTNAANRRHFADVADFTARLVDRLSNRNRVTGIERGLGLNVNYPGLAPRQVEGVRVAVQGKAVLFPPAFEETSPGTYVSTARPTPPRRDVPHSDTIFFYRGFITIVPIDADYTAHDGVRRSLARSVAGLQP